MNQELSESAGRLESMPDVTYIPHYLWTGIFILCILLLILTISVLLLRKKINRKVQTAMICSWLAAAGLFAAVLYLDIRAENEKYHIPESIRDVM